MQVKPANNMAETAKLLGIGHQKLYDLINSGALRTYTVGRRRYCSGEAILEFIREREAEAKTA
jgi:excisionase family DNA binding protein